MSISLTKVLPLLISVSLYFQEMVASGVACKRIKFVNFFALTYQHRWFSGRMLACHAGGPGSIPGRCRTLFFTFSTQYICFTSLQTSARKTNKTFFFRDKKGLVINQRFAELVQFPMSKLSDFFTQSRYFFSQTTHY